MLHTLLTILNMYNDNEPLYQIISLPVLQYMIVSPTEIYFVVILIGKHTYNSPLVRITSSPLVSVNKFYK